MGKITSAFPVLALAVGVEATTPAGKFTDCIRVKDYAPLPNATSDLVRLG